MTAKVKPLVWVEVTSTYWDREADAEKPSALFWEAETILACGGYQIMQMIDERFRGDKESYSVKIRGKEMKFPTIEAAKAAAQADYEARILAAIEAPDHLALVAAAYRYAAGVLDNPGDKTAVDALGLQLCCNGQHCGCRGADVGAYLQHLIRQQTPADAEAHLTALLRAEYERGKAEEQARAEKAVDRIGQARLLTDTGASLMGETMDYSPRVIDAILAHLDVALTLLTQEGR